MPYCKGIEFLVVAATARQVPATFVRFVPNSHFNQIEAAMTKNELRILLADLVPAAIADGRAYVVRSPAGKAVREIPNDVAPPHIRPARPRSMYQRQGVYGAGFQVQTYKTFGGVRSDDPVHDRKADGTVYYCFTCKKFGKDCTC